MEFLACTQGTQGTGETFRWPDKPIILSIRHLESPTEVQLNSWYEAFYLWFQNSLKKSVNYTEIITNFF